MYPDTPGRLLYIPKCIPYMYTLASPGIYSAGVWETPRRLQTRGMSVIHRCLVDTQGCIGYADVSRRPRACRIHAGVFNTP